MGVFDGMDPFSAIGNIASSVVGYFGQKSANRANINIGRENNAFSARQAEMNRQFQQNMWQKSIDYQTQMSNTSWQRGVSDMRAAGINPMLAVSQGGASSPGAGGTSGNSAAGIAAANQQSDTAAASANMRDFALTRAQLMKTAADIENVKVNSAKQAIEAEKAKAGIPKVAVEGDVYSDIQKAYQALKVGYGNVLTKAGQFGGWLGNTAASIVHPNRVPR